MEKEYCDRNEGAKDAQPFCIISFDITLLIVNYFQGTYHNYKVLILWVF